MTNNIMNTKRISNDQLFIPEVLSKVSMKNLLI